MRKVRHPIAAEMTIDLRNEAQRRAAKNDDAITTLKTIVSSTTRTPVLHHRQDGSHAYVFYLPSQSVILRMENGTSPYDFILNILSEQLPFNLLATFKTDYWFVKPATDLRARKEQDENLFYAVLNRALAKFIKTKGKWAISERAQLDCESWTEIKSSLVLDNGSILVAV